MINPTDLRADIAAVLADKTRREIRDLLRNSDPLTLTEIARSIGHSEQNTYYHLNKMLEANIVTKTTTKINGRLVTVYSLSETYNKAFAEPKPDLTPLYLLLGVYITLTLLLIMAPQHTLIIYKLLSVTDPRTAVMLNLTGVVTASVIILSYSVQNIITKLKYKLKRLRRLP